MRPCDLLFFLLSVLTITASSRILRVTGTFDCAFVLPRAARVSRRRRMKTGI